jgi:hypothetical protein
VRKLRDGTAKSLTYIVGPLFSGKARPAKRIAETLPDAAFIGLDRNAAALDADPALRRHPGAPGYEAVAMCLASPDVRARTQGVIAWIPPAA